MRARLARPRQSIRGRLVAPVAAAAAVALVGGVVVASPDTPTLRGDVQTVAETAQEYPAGVEFSFTISGFLAGSEWEGMIVSGVHGLPDGLEFDDEDTVSGIVETPGEYSFDVHGTHDGTPAVVEGKFGVVVGGAGGGAHGGAQGGFGGGGQIGGEAGGHITTGSEGTDAILDAVAGIVVSLGGDAGSVAELAAGSTGGGETNPENPENPGGPLGSLGTGQLGLGSLGGGEVNPENPDSPEGSLGSEGTVEGGGDADLETGGEIQTGSAGGTDTGGEITIPGSTTTAETGSLGNVAPGLAVTGAALLGLAGLSLVLNGGSSTPGATSSLPALPGSSTTGGTGSGTGSVPGSSGNGSVAPTVAAGSPAQAPGPTVANGRG